MKSPGLRSRGDKMVAAGRTGLRLMKITPRKLKFAWKYRRLLWKYRTVIRYRYEIAGGIAVAATVLAAGILANRAQRA